MESERLPDISYTAPLLDVPDPPPDLPYSAYEDYRARVVLQHNDIDVDEASLVEELIAQTDLLQAYAAHTAGAIGARAAIPLLNQLLSSADDLVQVEAAFALVRMGVDAGRNHLITALDRPADAYLSSLTAAGYLAQCGDPRGYTHVAAGLESKLGATRMLACKQLYFLWPYHAPAHDVVALFTLALDDPEANVQWQALVQMRQLESAAFRALLDRFVAQTTDPTLRNVADQLVRSLAAD